ncbi:MAG: methylmalonyl-CoA mutase [Proteobacteria bacterium]|nr:methylmalonyl-CoA mutase [Pseudomonadota bacterium]
MSKESADKKVGLDRSFGGLVRTDLQSGIPVETFYSPRDVAHLEYEQDSGDPGEYPYTRGIYPRMYRDRLWIKSFIVSYATAEETNQAFKDNIASGQTGLRCLADLPTQSGIDPDHPSAWNAMMCGGVSTYALSVYERMLEGLPLEDVDYELAHSSISSALMFYGMFPALMENQGLDIARLRGANINDPFRARLVYNTPEWPNEINRRICLDLVEFSARHTPKWKAIAPNGVDPQQTGANVIEELAGCLGVATAVYGELIEKRGVSLDDIGATVFSLDAESDFFETIAKFRAARRMWARIAKEKLGARTPRAMSLRIGIRTSGMSLTTQKPLNNAARVTLQILSCVLGGVNSLDASSIDEAIGLPSLEARTFNLDAQHIVTHEANVPMVADPLGGSYYLEWLTDHIEKGVNDYLAEIEAHGGMWNCLESGWLRKNIEASRMKAQLEKRDRKRIIVGVNAFEGEGGLINNAISDTAYKVPTEEDRRRNVCALQELKQRREPRKVKDTLTELFRAVKEGRNVVRPTIEAVKAYATIGEVVGVVRLGYGLNYDPFDAVDRPAFLDELR